MSFVATDLKGLLTLNIKSRHDGYLDQYNRIFMVKLLMVATIVMGLSWYGDSIHCIIPGKVRLHTPSLHDGCIVIIKLLGFTVAKFVFQGY